MAGVLTRGEGTRMQAGEGSDPLLLPGLSFKAGPTAGREGPGLSASTVSGACHPSDALEQLLRSSAHSPSLDLRQSGAGEKGKT